ncbi:MAG: hypothetical protein II341_05905, partial [Oscillospiraceae bacterium]|nr:hypothetical protein [Oscillospiraceae bacterium]
MKNVWTRLAALMTAMVCCVVFAGQGEYAVLAETFGGIDPVSQLRAWAADEVTIVASGECGAEGDNLTWTLDSEGLLTISGEGEMENFSGAPWYDYRED